MHHSQCTPGLWIAQTHGRKRLGRVARIFPSHDIEVQFGADGPFEVLKPRSFRPATQEEISVMEGTASALS